MNNNLIIKALAIAGSVALLIVFAGLVHDGNAGADENITVRTQSVQRVKSFELPDSLYFAGERVPLENF